ncbi:MAG: NYN domain-containing protein [Acidobacteriia bacterium]|nr:NYN domain-containing protein [Terriglobia bacterium]
MDNRIAVYIDFDNMVLSLREEETFQVELILDRLKEKGKILLKRAYADWTRFQKYQRPLQENGIEMIEMPTRGIQQKNAADIKIVIDALETAFARNYVDIFAIVSGDSDFTPLVSKLREYNKTVIGFGHQKTTNRLLIDQCDEFIFYDALVRAKSGRRPAQRGRENIAPEPHFELLRDAMAALEREGIAEPHFSHVKQFMLRKNPAFDENGLGYKTFGKFLEAAQRKGVIKIVRDKKQNISKVESLD